MSFINNLFDSSKRMSRRIARLNAKQSVLSKKLDVANLKANIKSAKHGGNVNINKGKVISGLVAGAITSRYLINNKALDNQKKMFGDWMTSLDKRKDKDSKNKKTALGDNE